MNIFSNPIFLMVGGLLIFWVPRAFRLLAGLSLIAVGLAGLLAQSDSFLELE